MYFALQYVLHTICPECNTIKLIKGGIGHGFQIRPNKKESENKTIRFPLSLIERIDDAIKDNDVTFSAFVIQACEYALDNMEPESPEP